MNEPKLKQITEQGSEYWLDETDGWKYQVDENHSGYLYLNEETVVQYNIDREMLVENEGDEDEDTKDYGYSIFITFCVWAISPDGVEADDTPHGTIGMDDFNGWFNGLPEAIFSDEKTYYYSMV